MPPYLTGAELQQSPPAPLGERIAETHRRGLVQARRIIVGVPNEAALRGQPQAEMARTAGVLSRHFGERAFMRPLGIMLTARSGTSVQPSVRELDA